MQKIAFIKTQDGNITLIVGNKTFSVGTSHINYEKILEALKSKAFDMLESLVDVPATITNSMGGLGVSVRNGQVFYGEKPMHNTITGRILSFIQEGLPHEPLIKFLENIMQNPMPAAVEELYDFLEHKGFPITEDGCFIGYKKVREDYMDHHSGTIENKIGAVISMPRDQVDPNRRNECSYGLHVGTMEYARSFGAGHMLLVKVNPKDCIAVPKDHNASKLRVCEYEVTETAPEERIDTPMYPMPKKGIEYSEDESDNPYDSDDDIGADDEFENTPINTKAKPKAKKVKVTKTPKRAACTFCGAKGGKGHKANCKRPRK